jgi:hypothetical protein
MEVEESVCGEGEKGAKKRRTLLALGASSVGASEPVLFASETAEALRSALTGWAAAEDQSASPVMRGEPLLTEVNVSSTSEGGEKEETEKRTEQSPSRWRRPSARACSGSYRRSAPSGSERDGKEKEDEGRESWSERRREGGRRCRRKRRRELWFGQTYYQRQFCRKRKRREEEKTADAPE